MRIHLVSVVMLSACLDAPTEPVAATTSALSSELVIDELTDTTFTGSYAGATFKALRESDDAVAFSLTIDGPQIASFSIRDDSGHIDATISGIPDDSIRPTLGGLGDELAARFDRPPLHVALVRDWARFLAIRRSEALR